MQAYVVQTIVGIAVDTVEEAVTATKPTNGKRVSLSVSTRSGDASQPNGFLVHSSAQIDAETPEDALENSKPSDGQRVSFAVNPQTTPAQNARAASAPSAPPVKTS